MTVTSDFLQRMKAAGEAAIANLETKTKEEKRTYRPDLQVMRDIAEKYGGYKPDKPRWKEWPDEKKMRYCSRRTGRNRYTKEIGGGVSVTPMNCNICELCHKANSLALKEKVKQMNDQVTVPGQWRKKTVEDDKEAKALKKRVNRNLDGRYFESACPASDKHNDVYVYVPKGTSNPESYGDPVEIDELDCEAIYEANRKNGKHLSKGKAFKLDKQSIKKEDAVKVESYAIITENGDSAEIEEIMYRTNYLEKAKTADDVKRLYAYQLKFIIKELEDAGVKIAAVRRTFYYKSQAEMVEEWNSNVLNWTGHLSIFTSSNELGEAKTDTLTKRLYGPLAKVADLPIN